MLILFGMNIVTVCTSNYNAKILYVGCHNACLHVAEPDLPAVCLVYILGTGDHTPVHTGYTQRALTSYKCSSYVCMFDFSCQFYYYALVVILVIFCDLIIFCY